MISIIIPVYQVARYLPACLDSVLAQTRHDWEAILVDDGSNDGSGKICDTYAEKDRRFRVIHQENAGAANAKNAGLDAAQGDYIAFLDSDDTVAPHWLETALIALENADVVEYSFDRHYPQGYEPVAPIPAAEFDPEAYLAQYLDHWQCSLFWNKLFRAKLLNAIRFRKERRCIDDEFFTYKAVAGAKKIVRIPDVLYHYRQRRSSAVTSAQNALQKTRDSLAIRRERYEWIGCRFPGLRRKYLQKDVESLYYFCREFPFDSQSAKEFRSMVWYYLGQCFVVWPGFLTLRLVLGLLRFTPKALLQKACPSWDIPKEEYFD